MNTDARSTTARSTLVVGGDSMIGQHLAQELAGRDHFVYRTTRRGAAAGRQTWQLDLRDAVANWTPPQPISLAFLCAGVTSLDDCRRAPRETARINVEQTVALARSLVRQQVFVVFVSSNLVFDGRNEFCPAEQAVSPQTEYGRQKAAAERYLLQLGDSVAVVRFSKVLSIPCLLFDRWRASWQLGQTVQPVNDVVIAPLPLGFAVAVLRRVGERRLPGIWQASGQSELSYYDIASRLARRLGVAGKLVQPVAARQSGHWREAIPRHTTLDCGRLQRELGLEPPDVESTLDAVMGHAAVEQER